MRVEQLTVDMTKPVGFRFVVVWQFVKYSGDDQFIS